MSNAEKGDPAALESAEAAFNFAFGLRDPVGLEGRAVMAESPRERSESPGPCAAVVSATRASRQDLSVLKPSRAKLVKTRLGKAQKMRPQRQAGPGCVAVREEA